MLEKDRFFEKVIDRIDHLDRNGLKNLIENLQQKQRVLQLVFEALDEGIIITAEDRVVTMNNVARIILGYKSRQYGNFQEMDKYIANWGLWNILKFLHGEEDIRKEFTIHQQQEPKYYLVEKRTIEDNLVLYKLVDQTEKKKLQFQLKNIESVAALNTLASGIAHEIKNPLTAIDLHTQLIQRAVQKNLVCLDESILQYIKTISHETKRLNQILNDFLLAARPRQLKLSFEDINSFVQELLLLVKPELEEKNIALREEYQNIPKNFIDKDYLKQAILNLIKNAMDAMEKSSLKILTVRTWYDNGRDSTAIEIADTGCGISPDQIQKIFEPYYTTKEYGTGLGLTITYKIIKEHQGEIQIQSKPGEGTSFTVYIPIHKGHKLLDRPL
ncbi:two-component system sensor histidine kinase NtrB [Thermospira aquatica]|uniref:histidine kinase n=1 Tax=Thermospira aquatica TaxID=2828656 RepID=A0AAX3BCR9_9SPIR|nr:ATP-binding protein [Thermospira aquatica]URA09960.1 ATP-binding protein [Thermospira aquatica]